VGEIRRGKGGEKKGGNKGRREGGGSRRGGGQEMKGGEVVKKYEEGEGDARYLCVFHPGIAICDDRKGRGEVP